MGGVTTDLIASESNLREFASLVMEEVLAVANVDLEEYGHQQLQVDETMAYCWRLTDSMGAYKTSAAIDLVNGNEIELEFLFDSVLQRLRKYRPRIKCDHLESLLLLIRAVAKTAEMRKEKGYRSWSPTWGFQSDSGDNEAVK
jgi:ketopantoate reductase